MFWAVSAVVVITCSTEERSDLISLHLNVLEMEILCQAKQLLLLKYYKASAAFQVPGDQKRGTV